MSIARLFHSYNQCIQRHEDFSAAEMFQIRQHDFLFFFDKTIIQGNFE